MVCEDSDGIWLDQLWQWWYCLGASVWGGTGMSWLVSPSQLIWWDLDPGMVPASPHPHVGMSTSGVSHASGVRRETEAHTWGDPYSSVI